MSLMYPASTIRYRVVDGLVVILDLRSGQYLTLNLVASLMWLELVTHADQADRITAVAEAFEASAARIDADLRDFSRTCVERGLLQKQEPTVLPPPFNGRARCPLAVRAWLSLFLTTRSLARQGFAKTYHRYLYLPRPVSSASERRVAAAVRAFSRAELGFVISTAPADCLPRSLALWRFLLSVGVPAEHCIGVQRFPFSAHAWTEFGGRVLFDSQKRVSNYAEIARM
jgi:Transglutaminase-like superfamily/Coenzyme PQQ synthesis protein D (PqqD)